MWETRETNLSWILKLSLFWVSLEGSDWQPDDNGWTTSQAHEWESFQIPYAACVGHHRAVSTRFQFGFCFPFWTRFKWVRDLPSSPLVYIIYSKKMEIYDFMQIGSGFLSISFDVFMIKMPQFFFSLVVWAHLSLHSISGIILWSSKTEGGDVFCWATGPNQAEWMTIWT